MYQRLKLIKVQEDLVIQHKKNIEDIINARIRMEASRELESGNLSKHDIELKHHGIVSESRKTFAVIRDDCNDKNKKFGLDLLEPLDPGG